jgi:hypothetical protein
MVIELTLNKALSAPDIDGRVPVKVKSNSNLESWL